MKKKLSWLKIILERPTKSIRGFLNLKNSATSLLSWHICKQKLQIKLTFELSFLN